MRTRDKEVLRRLIDKYPYEFDGTDEDWLDDFNMMYEKDGSVALMTYNYPGVYTGHWFFEVHGRQALDLAKEMLSEIFSDGARLIRGNVERENKKSRWAARQIGMKSHGFMDFPKWGECEVFTMTKEDFEGQK